MPAPSLSRSHPDQPADGTLAIELSLGVLIWNRVARPWVLRTGRACTSASTLASDRFSVHHAGWPTFAFVFRPKPLAGTSLAARELIGQLRG